MMKKTLQIICMTLCFSLTLFTTAKTISAAPAISRETYQNKQAQTANEIKQWPIAQMYHNSGEEWPPVPGRYERKLPNGLVNAYINVTLLPDQWPVINLHACDYDGPNNEHGWEALDTNPGIWLGGTITAAQMGLAPRFVIGGKTVGMYRGNGVQEVLPNATIFRLMGNVTSLKDRIIIDFRGENPKGIPDIRGEYVLSKKDRPFADEYSAYALLEFLPGKETKTDFFDKSLQIKPEALTGSNAAQYKHLIGDFGYAVKVFQSGTLLRTFILPKDLTAVYRFDSNGNNVMIYNVDGSKG
ncbi:MAG: hypothetical protein IJV12_08495 [Acidaminococcaceae bacterium]|nr:hypothetical protein [Acidaminococcaceae bacterium]